MTNLNLFQTKYDSLSSEDTNPKSVHAEVSSSASHFNKPVSLGKSLLRSSKLLAGGDNASVGVYWNRNIKQNNMCIQVPWRDQFHHSVFP